jgi:hypothetical protein
MHQYSNYINRASSLWTEYNWKKFCLFGRGIQWTEKNKDIVNALLMCRGEGAERAISPSKMDKKMQFHLWDRKKAK